MGVVMRLAGKTAEPGVFSSFIQMAPTEICTQSPFLSIPTPKHTPVSGCTRGGKLQPQGLCQNGLSASARSERASRRGAEAAPYKGSPLFPRAEECSVTQQVGKG